LDGRENIGSLRFTLDNHPIYDATVSNHDDRGAQAGVQGSAGGWGYTMVGVTPWTSHAAVRNWKRLRKAEWFINAAKPEALARPLSDLKQVLEGEAKQEAKA